MNIIRTLTIFLLLTSCQVVKQQPDNYIIEINNKELSKQIVEYKHFIDSLSKGRPFVINVYCSEINDSVNKYIVDKTSSGFGFYSYPYHFKCKVNDFEVFFIMVSGLVNSPDYGKTDLNFFIVKQSIILEDLKNYFPEDYKCFMKNGNFPPPDLFEPEILHLTFVREKLVKKTYKRGSYRDFD